MNYLKSKIFQIVSEEAAGLRQRAFVIGGYVRDSLMGRESKDVDIVVDGSGIELAQRVSKRVGTNVVVFKNFGTAMLKWRGLEVEFVGARRESYRADSRKPIVEDGSIEEDQLRRDFTINAMAFSLQKEDFGSLSDPFNGLSDLNNRLIRTPLDPDTTYTDDPLRMLRAARFASQLSFAIVPESLESIKRNRERVNILSPERINEEFNKILLSPKPSVGLYILEYTGILNIIFPQLVSLKGVETVDGRGHKENFSHTLQVIDNIAEKSDYLWLRWAALLHDIGKPATKFFEPEIGWTFHAHDFVGARMVPKIFKQFRLPLDDRMKYVQKLVQLHLRPISLAQDDVTDSAIRRLLFDAGDDIEDLMQLCEADITSKNEYTLKRYKTNFLLVRQKLIEVEEKDTIRNFKNPITGEMIMERYNIPPCSEIGIIKERIKNAILDGEIGNNLEEATRLMETVAEEVLSKHLRN